MGTLFLFAAIEQGKQAMTLLLASKARRVVSESMITIRDTGESFRVPSKLGRVNEVPAIRLVRVGLSSLRKKGVEWVFSASISHGS